MASTRTMPAAFPNPHSQGPNAGRSGRSPAGSSVLSGLHAASVIARSRSGGSHLPQHLSSRARFPRCAGTGRRIPGRRGRPCRQPQGEATCRWSGPMVSGFVSAEQSHRRLLQDVCCLFNSAPRGVKAVCRFTQSHKGSVKGPRGEPRIVSVRTCSRRSRPWTGARLYRICMRSAPIFTQASRPQIYLGACKDGASSQTR
jgi:hypothetical protein